MTGKRLINNWYKIFLLIPIFWLQACATNTHVTNKNLVVIDPAVGCKAKTVQVFEDKPNTKISLQHQHTFKVKLEDKLYQNHTFTQGNDLTIRYHFVQYNDGKKHSTNIKKHKKHAKHTKLAKNSINNNNNAEGSFTIECLFVNKKGYIIGKVQTMSKIEAGSFDEHFDRALTEAADNVAAYVIRHYK